VCGCKDKKEKEKWRVAVTDYNYVLFGIWCYEE
jgi:hypothetical protein